MIANMNILVIGSGAREHCVIKKLKENTEIERIYCLPGNGGISIDADCSAIPAADIVAVVDFCRTHSVDFAVVTPDDPLARGMVDALEENGIPAFGPDKRAAEIESSKIFSKEFMRRHSIPTAMYESFSGSDEALRHINSSAKFPLVIKADGLALGKGVVIAGSKEEAIEAVNSMMIDRIFGQSGNRIVIEEFIEGTEVSVLCFTDGKTIKPMIPSMDHKRALDGDNGLNTGGMGAISPHPIYTPEIAERCMNEIFLPTIRGMAKEGRPFKGCLYFGLMLSQSGPKVIEYNCRFGDPETQVVLPLLKTDLLEIMRAVRDERLDSIDIEWSGGSAACVVMASEGYPQHYRTGEPISGLDKNGQLDGVTVYHAGTRYKDGDFYTGGGRVLCVTSVADNLETALSDVYGAISKLSFNGAHYRTDIGKQCRMQN